MITMTIIMTTIKGRLGQVRAWVFIQFAKWIADILDKIKLKNNLNEKFKSLEKSGAFFLKYFGLFDKIKLVYYKKGVMGWKIFPLTM